MRYNAGTTPTDYTYTGQYSNTADFGLMFYNARWYDPYLGRMAQADTIIPPGVQGLDRYAYANNSPLNFVDPSGHEPKGPGSCYGYNWLTGECAEIGISSETDPSNEEEGSSNPNPTDVFDDMADEEGIAFNYPNDGCYARAHLMSRLIYERYGINVSKVWAFGNLSVNTDGAYGLVEWGYHVAPVVEITNPDGTTSTLVIDPSIADHPVTIDEWLGIMNTSANESNVQVTSDGQAPYHPGTGSDLPGSGYWPGDDPTVYGGSLTYYSFIVMETYGACGAAGSACQFIEPFTR